MTNVDHPGERYARTLTDGFARVELVGDAVVEYGIEVHVADVNLFGALLTPTEARQLAEKLLAIAAVAEVKNREAIQALADREQRIELHEVRS